MLENVDLSRRVGREEYKERRNELRDRIYAQHRAAWEHDVATIVLIEGVEASGRGDAIRVLTRRMEPRGFTVHAISDPRSSAEGMPWLWRFWGMLPTYGSMAIFNQSWYRRLLVEGVDDEDARRAVEDINGFEKTLADDGYLFVKVFLVVSKKEQRRRLKALADDELTAWQVTDDDWGRNKRYDEHLEAAHRTLARTESEWAPWAVVPAEDRHAGRLGVLTAVADRLGQRLAADGVSVPDGGDGP